MRDLCAIKKARVLVSAAIQEIFWRLSFLKKLQDLNINISASEQKRQQHKKRTLMDEEMR